MIPTLIVVFLVVIASVRMLSLLALRDEVELLAPAFAAAGGPCVLVGHSYGAAVALVAAATYPERVRALALYEPTLFALVDAGEPPPNDADGIKAAVTVSITASSNSLSAFN